MLDWLTSKVALIIAAAVILAVLIGFFAYHQATLEQESLSDLSQDLAHFINDVTSRDSEIKMRVTFSSDVDSYELPSTVNGKYYTIQISSTQVILRQQGADVAMQDLLNPVHIFPPPSASNLDPQALTTADMLVAPLMIGSGNDFYIESRLCEAPAPAYPTFCYVSQSKDVEAYAVSLASEMDTFNTFDATDPDSLNASLTLTCEHNVTLGHDVIVAEGRFVAQARITHLWKPGLGFDMTKKDINASDLVHDRLDLEKGKDLMIERRYFRFTDVLVRLNDTLSAPAEGVEIFAYAG
jgi:hypothetical protein